MTRAVAMKGAKCWRLIPAQYTSRGVRGLLFDTYLNPPRVMSDEPSSLPRGSIGTALESVLRVRALLAPRVRC
jgi:hypothetical protein